MMYCSSFKKLCYFWCNHNALVGNTVGIAHITFLALFIMILVYMARPSYGQDTGVKIGLCGHVTCNLCCEVPDVLNEFESCSPHLFR